MKNAAWLIIIAVLAFAGYVFAGPYMTINQLKAGIQEEDSARLESNIDFPLLRKNLKSQFNKAMGGEASAYDENNPLGEMAAGGISGFVDMTVESIGTPDGMASLMKGKVTGKVNPDNPTSDPHTESREPFEDARYSFDSHSQCSVYVPADDGDEVRFILTRSGTKWKLSDIDLPIDK